MTKDKPFGQFECPECHVIADHTWWCSIAPVLLPNGKLAYYWRDA